MKHQKLQTTPEISKRMSKVRLKGNSIETMLAKELWRQGYRYRLNYKKLPGSPDIAITKYKIAIFVDGEFWHGKDFDKRKISLKSNKNYWIRKIEENMERDLKVDKQLQELGWLPIHFWSQDVKQDLRYCINTIEDFITYQNDGRILF